MFTVFAAKHVVGVENDNDSINNLLSKIRNTINTENGFKQHDSRMKAWKENVYESEILLDDLLEIVKNSERSSDNIKFPGENPFREIRDNQWKSFRFLIKYRNFIFDTVKEIDKDKYRETKALSGRVVIVADSFRRDAHLGKGGDLEKVFNIQKSVKELEERVKKANSIEAVRKILNNEIKATQEAFIDLKKITDDLKILNRQFRMIKKYYETGKSLPQPLNPQPPTDEISEKPTPEFTPSRTPAADKTPQPAIKKTPRPSPKPTPKHTPAPKPAPGKKLDLEIGWSDGYPYIGKKVKFWIVKVDNGRRPYQFKWFMNGKTIGKGSKTVHTFKNDGKYELKVIVIDRNRRKASKTRQFIVSKKDLNFKYGWSPGLPEKSGKIRCFVRDLSGGIPPYKIRWSMDDKIVGTGTKGIFNFPNADRANLSISVMDSRGKVKMGFHEIKADNNPLDFKFWWTRSTPIAGQTVRFGVKDIKGGSAPYNIRWKMNGKVIGTGEKIRYKFDKTGKNILEVEVSDSKRRTKTGTRIFDIGRRPGK